MQLHARIARLRGGATSKFALTHARLRVLGIVARMRGLCISDIARELDLTRQAVHRVVHDLVELKMLELVPSTRSRRERIPRLIAGGRVAAACGVGWERRWFEQLGQAIDTRDLQWMHSQAQRHRRNLPWRVDDPEELEVPDPPPPTRFQFVPGTGGGWRTRM
jgi:DNA-binding MarR family transcriptional regulator